MLSKEERITNRKQLKEWIGYERQKYPCNFAKQLFKIGENAILLNHQKLLRKTEYCLNSNKKLRYVFLKFRLLKLQNRYALHIPLNCCGKGLKIMHLGPVLINNRATIGKDCSIHMNSAIVAGGTSDGVPTLGDHVVVGYGACILGEIKIADNVAVGANAVVNKDCVENGVTLAGVPARIISKKGSTAWNKTRI